jgi:hypothetical protein
MAPARTEAGRMTALGVMVAAPKHPIRMTIPHFHFQVWDQCASKI